MYINKGGGGKGGSNPVITCTCINGGGRESSNPDIHGVHY